MSETKAILDKLAESGNPIIDGNRALIYWRGSDPPVLMSDITHWEDGEPLILTKVKKNLWVHEIELPADAYIEYSFFRDDDRILDPLNPKITPNGLGDLNNFFGMSEYKPTDWINHTYEIPHGKVFTGKFPVDFTATGKMRTVYFYQPPVEQPVPLIVVYDGAEYNFRARLPDIMDNLLAAKRIRPAALAMISNSHLIRPIEYGCSEITIKFIVQFLLPVAHQKLNLLDPTKYPGSFGIVGASMGGLQAFYTALRLPNIFGRALVQSSAFSMDNFDFIVWELLKSANAKKVNFWVDCGKFELLVESNRKMAKALEKRGCKFIYKEYSGGHNYPSWRDDLPNGLEYLFGSLPEATNVKNIG